MMRIAIFSGALCAALLSAAVAEAQPRPAAGDCRAMSQAYGPENLWWGRFSGGKEMPQMGFGDHDPIFIRTFERCFVEKASCDRWLYEMKSEYNMQPRWNQCDRGYGSRVRLKQWWEPKRPR